MVFDSDSKRLAELESLAAQQKSELDALNSDKINLQTKLDELRMQTSQLKNQVEELQTSPYRSWTLF